MNQTSYLLFVTSAPGLEPLLARELTELGFASEAREGGVELRATRDGLWKIALGSALAEGVRVRLKSFVARDFGALLAGLGRLPWRAYLQAGSGVQVRVTCHRSKLWHSGAVAERVQQVLGERVGATVSDGADDEPAEELPTVFVRITGDAVQVSVDAGGRLHRRGYRTHVEKASLRETLAAALVRTAEELRPGERPRVLWDPFAGAGTIVCEAARAWGGILPGAQRTFPFQAWPTHDVQAFALAREALAAERSAFAGRSSAAPECIGSDLSEHAILAARHNAELGGVSALARFLVGDFEAVAAQIPRGAWLMSNPPYGERLAQNGLMTKLDRLCAQRSDLRPALVLVGGAAKKELPSGWRVAFSTKNGGLDVAARSR